MRIGTRGKVFGAVAALFISFSIGAYAGLSGLWGHIAAAESVAPAFTLTFGGATQPANIDTEQFWRAWNLLQDNFVQTHASSSIPTDQEKVYGAIKGLTESYGDPYTTFFPPAEAQIFQENVSGSFGGVGMEIGMRDQVLTIVAPLKDSPAERAGVRSGDKLLMVGTTTVDGFTVEQAVQMIRGPVGTPVTVVLGRAGEQKPLTVTIVRDTINIPVIDSYKRSDGIYVIELYSFSQTSNNLFRDALRQFMESGSTKLVLDLRGNPGGYLEVAVSMASYFLPVGAPIVTEDYRGKEDNVVHRSYGYNVFANKKLSMAILVDQGSASASEILAGALQQNHVAKLVGTRTFGKGSVQELLSLGGGAQLKVTIARWLTPNGSSISDGGLTPDISAERTTTDYTANRDPQMDAAVLWLTSQ